MLLLPLYERRLPSVHVRVEQDLVRGGLDLRSREQCIEVRNLEVADTDAPKWRSDPDDGETRQIEVYFAFPSALIFSIFAQAVAISGTARRGLWMR